ncbi:MAG: FecR family protein [Pedobacter sp.]|nr:MAG: FecR family protein [Pedobacter sp.]
MEHKYRLEELFTKYIKNECTEEELRFLLAHFESEDNKVLLENLIDASLKEEVPEKFKDQASVQQRIADARKEIHKRTFQKKTPFKLSVWNRIIAAASIILCIGAALYFYTTNEPVITPEAKTATIVQGGDKAILTLSDGSTISLTDKPDGNISNQPGLTITKTANGEIVYETKEVSGGNGNSKDQEKYNTITTPRGGKFSVVLPEGTRIWLNAASSISYTATFSERSVILTGEAYFEVAKIKNRPFKLLTGNQTLEVLGTHFNVSSYPDEPLIKTTLLEGSVRVKGKNEAILKPGEQSQTNHNADGFHIVNVDPDAEIAWKNNLFFFENESIKEIMLQIARWYDVEVVYKDNVSHKKVWGSITRFSEISKVLDILELTGKIHFKVEGRRITVMK